MTDGRLCVHRSIHALPEGSESKWRSQFMTQSIHGVSQFMPRSGNSFNVRIRIPESAMLAAPIYTFQAPVTFDE